jgi:CheY-like chemotaxis protein
VLAQLLSNAVKFSRPGARVQVASRVQARDVVVSVSDQGSGISADRLRRLFEPPWVDRSQAIVEQGIGLVIAQATAQRMGGRIDVARSDSTGSVFELRLPWARAHAAPPAAAGTAPASGPRVLYIEDNDVNMLIVRELLAQRPRLTFHGAPDGESGVRAARELQPALVLIDMQLPDIDGLEVLRRIRADPTTASITCVALSANAMPEDVRTARAAGFDDYWTKPIDLSAFLTALDRLLPSP